MRKRDSKRRWKKRAAMGRFIPMTAIVEHGLDKWFRFILANTNAELYWADSGGLASLVSAA